MMNFLEQTYDVARKVFKTPKMQGSVLFFSMVLTGTEFFKANLLWTYFLYFILIGLACGVLEAGISETKKYMGGSYGE